MVVSHSSSLLSLTRYAMPPLPENLGVRFAEIHAVQGGYDYTVAPEHSLVIIEEVDH
jgi:hypothetical protein